MNKGWVYLIRENGDDLLHKIGVTTGDIDKRIKKLQTGNGNQLVLVNSYQTSTPFKLEKMLHRHFSENREEGEWFLLDKNDISKFSELCQYYQGIIDGLAENPFF